MRSIKRGHPGLVTLSSVEPHAGATEPVVRLEIKGRAPAFGGASFGDAGPYERLTGIAHFVINPKAPSNRIIVDLDHAPSDAAGMVHYDTDVEILRPRNSAKARRVMLYDVVNRGTKLLPVFHDGGLDGMDGGPNGIEFAMRRGYTMIWSGWQGDVDGPSLIGARFPIASGRNGPITGRITVETIFDDTSSNVIRLPYSATTTNQKAATLAVRDHIDDPDRMIPVADWHYQGDREIAVTRPAGTDAGAIYRFTYLARDPKVMGLGFSAVRDLVSFLRHASAEQGNPLADLAMAPCDHAAGGKSADAGGGVFETAIGFGTSQSGRFLRDYLWQGFNRDLGGRSVFDGLVTVATGARRTFTNFRFSEPNRFARQHEDHEVPGLSFPFAYQVIDDPVTGKADGLLAKSIADHTCPKIFHIDTSTEFWQGAASLVGTGGTDGDLSFPPSVRAYFLASVSHAPGMVMPPCQFAANPLKLSPVNALIVAMVEWTTGQHAPPENRWPRINDGTLVPLERLSPPDLSSLGKAWPQVFNRPIAPTRKRGWPVLLPSVDADGNDEAGIRLPELVAPLGTYVGWNPRKAGYAEGDLCNVLGGFVPFAADQVARGNDPRLSLAERYGSQSRDAILKAAAQKLVHERLLLKDDNNLDLHSGK